MFHNVKLSDNTIKDRYKTALENLLLEKKINRTLLFLAIKQEVGKFLNYISTVLNLRTKKRAR